MAGSYKSLARDPGLTRAVKGVLQSPEGRADTLRRRDVLGVQRALGDSAAAAAVTETTVADLVARVERLEDLLAYLEDETQIVAAWAHLQTDGSGNVSIVDGHGIASAVVSGSNVLLTFAEAMDSTEYATAGHAMVGAARGLFSGGETSTTVQIGAWTTTGGVNLATTGMDFGVLIVGRRAS